jgi:D-aminopeptidase
MSKATRPVTKRGGSFRGSSRPVVKQAESTELCTGLDQKAAHGEVQRKVAEALEKARHRELRPYRPALPMTISVRMRTMDGAARLAARGPGILRLDDHTVEARVGRLTGAGLEMDARA